MTSKNGFELAGGFACCCPEFSLPPPKIALVVLSTGTIGGAFPPDAFLDFISIFEPGGAGAAS